MSDRRQRLTAVRRGAWALVVAFVTLVGGGEVFANQVHAGTPDNVFVCKYVGTPGVDERLQTGDNPIRVSVSSIPAGAAVGASFADEQGRSVVLAFDVGQAEPDVSECPAPEGPPTTTMETTTTAAGPTTTAAGPTTTSDDDYPPQATPPTTVPVPGPGPRPGPGAGPGGLPETGSNSGSTLPIAVAALLAGAGLMLTAGMRRRPTKR